MKIAVIADLHLSNRREHPERYNTLENILQQMRGMEITSIIFAGDVFDAFYRNYADFEKICKNPQNQQIRFHILPGNHDTRLTQGSIAADNVIVYSEPTLEQFDQAGFPFLLLPYQKDSTMGEAISHFSDRLRPNEWILIGHGDWVEGLREMNPLEPGVYMPLARSDVETYRPALVVLGHIHKARDQGIVHYPGSPCALDITETGRRRFLVIDTESGAISSHGVKSDVIYLDESFAVLPVADERLLLRSQIESRLRALDFSEEELAKVQIRVKVRGYTSNRLALMQVLRECLHGMSFYQDQEPDLAEVYSTIDVERSEIAQRVARIVNALDWREGLSEPSKDQILLEALQVIYGD